MHINEGKKTLINYHIQLGFTTKLCNLNKSKAIIKSAQQKLKSIGKKKTNTRISQLNLILAANN